jgi:hypothetical protein
VFEARNKRKRMRHIRDCVPGGDDSRTKDTTRFGLSALM